MAQVTLAKHLLLLFFCSYPPPFIVSSGNCAIPHPQPQSVSGSYYIHSVWCQLEGKKPQGLASEYSLGLSQLYLFVP